MATLKDVAREAGLAVSTVSRVLNERGYISEETKKSVYDAMKKLNYQPNEMARSLSKQTTNTIGVIVPHIRRPYFAELISHIESTANKRKYKILLFNSRDRDDKEKEILDMCNQSRVAGILLCSGSVKIYKFEGIDIPLITIERNLEVGTASIECDNFKGGRLAALHLIERGCKNVAIISGVSGNNMPADSRELGFIQACDQHNIKHRQFTTSREQYDFGEYHGLAEEIVSGGGFDGVFASSDLIAAQIIQVCARLGKSVPEEIKVIGFDGVLISSLTTPAITTIRQPIKEMAQIAVSLLIEASQGKIVPNKTVLPRLNLWFGKAHKGEKMYDIVAVGECLIDFIPAGVNELGMNLFSRNAGGAPANVLAMAAKLGSKTAIIGKVGNDDFGRFLIKTIVDAGIDSANLTMHPYIPTTLAFVQLNEYGDRSFTFYRKPGADLCLEKKDIPNRLVSKCRIFHFGSVSMTDEPSKSATLYAVQKAKTAGAIISFDPNYRPLLWGNANAAMETIIQAIPLADVLKVSEEEMTLLTGETDWRRGAETLRRMGPSAVVVTLGEKGAYFLTPAGDGHKPAFDVKTIDTTGAGDAFWGTFLHRILSCGVKSDISMPLSDWEQCIIHATAAGSLTTASKGAIPAMPDKAAIQECISNETLIRKI